MKDWVSDKFTEFAGEAVDTYGEHNAESDLADVRRELGTEACGWQYKRKQL
jgi:hypothetical protein